jgi:tetratricopeptide (TPR) repeat protein
MAKNGLAVAYDTVGQRHESLRYANEAARLAREVDDQRLLALALNNQAQFLKENGQNEQANELFQQVQAIGRTLNDEELVMAGAIGLGRTTGMADAQTAVAHYEEALAMAKAQGDDRAIAICLNNLSDWRINLGQYEEAIALREECLRLSQQLGFRMGVGRAYIGMAKAYTLMGNLAKARELLNKGFPVAVRASDLEGDLHASLNLAYLYVQSGDIPRAIELYRQVLERSLAAPDYACAVFAQKALELLADDETPPPGIVLSVPADAAELTEDELETVVGGLNPKGGYTYPTGDLQW